TDRSGGKSSASERRKLDSAYMPSGNTRLQRVGVYASGTRQTICFQIPSSAKSGIHHVPHPQISPVTPSMNAPTHCTTEISLSVSTKTEPAFVLIAAAPIPTHKDGVTSSGLISEKKIR